MSAPSTSRRHPASGRAADGAENAALVLRQFRQVLNSVKTHFQQVEKKVGLGGAQVWALSVIRERPGLGVGELAQSMDIHQSTASNLVRVLVERGFIETRREGSDRRSVQLYLLSEGGKVLRRVPGPFEGVLPSALRALDPRTLRRLRKDLAELIRVLDVDEKAGRIPLAEL
ncbi:MAG: MarR family winged helix-turn-helix transcriptional regulator [Pseudomonadota bacterium]